ncbi:MAG: hypothetical protein HRT61_06020 [Ekhidna sp.]|nr:hypothetical protein [Ekhidna sp.]
MKGSLSILTLFLLITSCDPCEDCGAAISSEPTVSFVFINQDSIQQIDDSLAVFAFNDSSLTSNIDSLIRLRDSLQIVNDSIENGGILIVERQNLEQWIVNRKMDSMFFAELNEDADSLSTLFNGVKSTISSGLLEVSQIEVLGTSFIETYEDIDSATSWKVPLSYQGLFGEYEVRISDRTDRIIIEYENFQEVDEERTLLIRAQDIRVTESTYDSLINCEVNCLDGETIFTFYF